MISGVVYHGKYNTHDNRKGYVSTSTTNIVSDASLSNLNRDS
jgi:hypothetical protein